MRTYLGFDMRSPEFGAPTPKLYAAALDMAAYADEHGMDYTVLMEHHGSPDGYLPAPTVMGAAVAARTRRMRIVLAAIVLPLHDPVKIAEQIAVVDQISDGRLDVVFGAGYVPSEFRMFDVDIHARGRMMDESLPIVVRALSGERFVAGGREILVRPRPVQQPHPRLFVGGGVPAAARRAARLGLGFYPLGPQLVPVFEAACAELGRPPGPVLVQGSWMHVTEDPERSWRELAPHVLHVARSYAQYAEEAGWTSSPFFGVDSLEKAKACGMFQVVTPEHGVRLAQKSHRAGMDPGLMPLAGGLDPETGWRSLELFVEKVLPQLRTPAG